VTQEGSSGDAADSRPAGSPREGIPASHVISDEARMGHWFATHPREVSVTLAARAALRALPLAAKSWNRGELVLPGMLPVFRAAAAAWTVAMYPTHRSVAVAAARAAGFSSVDDAPDAIQVVVYAAAAAATTTPAAQANSAVFAARAASASARSNAALADPILADIMGIEGGGSEDRVMMAVDLADEHLWPYGLPSWVESDWAELRGRLSAAGDHWHVWIDWYEGRLYGRPSLGVAFDIAVAMLADKLWQQGPEAVNPVIRLLIEAHTHLPPEESLPEQRSRAAVFVRDSTGVIGIAPAAPQDRLSDTAEVRDFYVEVRQKAAALALDGPNLLGSRLHAKLIEFQARLPENMADAVERLVWSSGNGLRGSFAQHRAVRDQRDLHPHKLDAGVAEGLRELVETFNQLAVADPKLRDRDASRPGPQERQRWAEELRTAGPLTSRAANDRRITSAEAGNELVEQIEAAAEAGEDLPGALSLELASATQRHFLAGAMIAVYRAMRSLPASARLEGGKVSKEIFSGLYRAAGPAAVAYAYLIRWEIIDLIISNADVLRAYAAIAFEHSPGFRQMIEYLEVHATDDNSEP
jgi:hypothetical protein